MDTIEVATRVEEKLHNLLDHPSQGISEPFSLPESRLYGIVMSEDEPKISFLASQDDVYELLLDKSIKGGKRFDYLGIVTTGWASPLNEAGDLEGRPSEHPERRRVRLMVVASPEGMASVLRFQDDPSNPITDPGSATGTLADAIKEFLAE
jgi:hypothetical protein